MSHIKKSQSGFGLVEILVATSLLGIISYAIVDVIQNAGKSQIAIQAKDQQRDLSGLIKNSLKTNTACINTFNGIVYSTDMSIPSIKNDSNNIFLQVGGFDRSGLLKIEDIQVKNWIPSAANPLVGSAELQVVLSRKSAGNASKFLKPDVIYLYMTKNASNQILDCVSLDGSSASTLWSKIGSTDDIEYTAGSVKVGSHLIVNAEVKIGTTSQVCDISIEGSQRYNSSSKSMEFCDATSWKPFYSSSMQNCIGSWSTCNTSTNTQTYNVIQPAAGGGSPCPYGNGVTRSCTVTPTYSCASGWTLSAPSCQTAATPTTTNNTQLTCQYTCQGAGGCVSSPCPYSAPASSNGTCASTYSSSFGGPCTLNANQPQSVTTTTTTYSCPAPSTLNPPSTCMTDAYATCPSSYPNLSSDRLSCSL